MPFARPTLAQLRDRIKGDLRTSTNVKAIARRSFLDVIAKALSGITHTLHGHLVFISRQIFPDQADAEFLARWGGIYEIDQIAATFAKLNVLITGTAGTNLVANTVFKSDAGVLYQVETTVVIPLAGTPEIAAVLVCETSGVVGNLDAGEILTIETPVVGIDSDTTVTSVNTEGEDQETDESYRERIVDRIQQPPSGGTANDYIQFARSVAGVTRAWVNPGGAGEGTVVVYFVEDGEDPIIPLASKIAEVDAVIQEQKPVTSQVFTVAPIPTELDIDVKIEPFTTAVESAINDEIKDLLSREANVRGAYLEVGALYDGIISISKIREAISIAAGEEDHVLVSPTEDVVPAQGGIVIEGTITTSPI
jgi:uncharacterized phage protein gp47/JayE